jgi:hypothetical protein
MSSKQNQEISTNKTGILLSWKLIGSVVAILVAGGGGGSLITNIFGVFNSDAKAQIKFLDEGNKSEHVKIKESINKQEEAIKSIDSKLNVIYKIQVYDIASRYAHMITDTIKDSRQRELIYGSLLRKNMSRLQGGYEPCTSLECDD